MTLEAIDEPPLVYRSFPVRFDRPELSAMDIAVTLLEELPEKDRGSVARYLHDRFGGEAF